MKKQSFNCRLFLLAILAVVLNTTNAWAQPKKAKQRQIKYITLDYLSDADQSYLYTENFETSVGLKIENINKRVVDINKEIISTSFHTEKPALFDQFGKTSLPDGNNGKPEDAKAFTVSEEVIKEEDVKGISDEKIRQAVIDFRKDYISVRNNLRQYSKATDDYMSRYRYVRELILYHSYLKSLEKKCNTAFSALLAELNEKTTAFLISDRIKLDDILKPADAMLAASKDYSTNRELLSRFSQELIYQLDVKHGILVKYFLDGNIKKLEASIEELRKQAEKIVAAIVKIKSPNAFEKKIHDFLSNPNTVGALESQKEAHLEFYELMDIATLHKNIQAYENTGHQELLDDYDAFTQSNYTYFIPPQALNKDLTVIKVNILPKDNVPCSPIPRAYEISIRTKKGVKIDFSSGLFGTFGAKKFLDQTYRFEDLPGDSTLQVVQNKNKNSLYPGIGALMHIYIRNGSDFQPSLCFGISTRELDKVNYHLGGSFIMGTAQRVILSGGLTLGKANLIADQYEVGQVIKKSGAPENVPTANYTRLGWFFSFTYNLASK